MSVERYIAADRIFALEFYAKGGKKILIEYIKECDKASDVRKWFGLLETKKLTQFLIKIYIFKRSLLYNLFKIFVLLIKNWALISWDSPEIDLFIIKLVKLSIWFFVLAVFQILFYVQICETLNDSTKENKKSVIPDQLVLLFLNIVDDILNHRFIEFQIFDLSTDLFELQTFC